MTSGDLAEARPFEGLDIERTLLSFQRPCRVTGRKKASDSRQRPSVLLAYYSMRAEGAPGGRRDGLSYSHPFGRPANDSRAGAPVNRYRISAKRMKRRFPA